MAQQDIALALGKWLSDGERVTKAADGLVGAVPAILDTLDPLFRRYADEREPGERFGDFLVRGGIVSIDSTGSRTLPLELVA